MQPDPVANVNACVWDAVIQRARDARNRHCGGPPDYALEPAPVRDALIADMVSMDERSRAFHGKPLQAHDGDDSLKEAMQDALSLTVYLEKAAIEAEAARRCGPDGCSPPPSSPQKLHAMSNAAEWLALQVRQALYDRDGA